jgi:uncharacterized protein YraI
MRVFASLVALAAVWMAAPVAAHADPGFIAMRTFAYAGPDEDFPRVAYLRRGTRLEVRGCIERYDWCDVQWGRHRDDRGWVNEDAIAFYYRGRSWRSYDYFRFRRPAIVIWDIDRYWYENYRGERFFRQRDSFRRFGSHDEHNRNNGDHERGDRGDRGGAGQSQGPNTNELPRDDHRGDRSGSGHDQNGSGQDQGANDNSGGSDQQHHNRRGQTQSDTQHPTDTPANERSRHSDASGSQGPQGQQTGQGQGSQTGTPGGQGHGDAQGQGAEQEHTGHHNRDRNANDNPHNCPLNDQHQPVCPSPQ